MYGSVSARPIWNWQEDLLKSYRAQVKESSLGVKFAYAVPAAILEQAAGIVKHPVAAIEHLMRAVQNIAFACFDDDYSIKDAIHSLESFAGQLAFTPIAIIFAPAKIIHQIFEMTLSAHPHRFTEITKSAY